MTKTCATCIHMHRSPDMHGGLCLLTRLRPVHIQLDDSCEEHITRLRLTNHTKPEVRK